MNGVRALRREVFPDAVPPAIIMFISYSMHNHRSAATSFERVFTLGSMRWIMVHGFLANFLMVSVFPLVDIGNNVALTLSPLIRWASMRGMRFVICLPILLPIIDA